MEDNRWPKRITTWSPEGRRGPERTAVKWEEEVERVMKQRNVTSDDVINRKPRRRKASNGWTTGKLTQRHATQ
jgi:hypothetical protein